MVLADIAFGADPGRAAGELPSAPDVLGRWYRAVALCGQGRYAAARVEVQKVYDHTADPVLRSLAESTEGSILRQLGWHRRAAAFDGRAAAVILGTDTATSGVRGVEISNTRQSYVPDAADALCDALTGLAADALGAGRFSMASRLLRRATATLPHGGSWRPEIRLQWVFAETAMATGDFRAACEHAAVAAQRAESAPSVRHQVKSRLLVAATAAAAGARERSDTVAAEVSVQCREYGLLPLQWACAMLRAGLGVETATQEAAECAAILARRGGMLRPLGA